MTNRNASLPILIIGAGSLSAVGATLPVQAAAVHAGLTRMALHPDVPDASPSSTRVARAGYFADETSDPDRLRALLAAAVAEATPKLNELDSVDVSLAAWLVIPPERPPYSEEDTALIVQAFRNAMFPLTPVRLVVIQDPSVSAGTLLAAARDHIATAPAKSIAVIAAADTLVSDDAMDHLVEARRLAREDRPWGLTPGEGAACLVLAHESWTPGRALGAQSRLMALGNSADHPNGGSPEPKGHRLGQAVQAAVAAAGPQLPFRLVYSDANGERARSDGWSFAAPRFSAALDPHVEIATPASSQGDLGAANTLSLLALATDDLASGRHDGPILIAVSGEEGASAAMVLAPSLSVASRPGLPNPNEELAAYDHEVIEELISEVKALWERRNDLLQDQQTALLPDWTQREPLDKRIDRIITALATCGETRRAFAVADLESGEPSGVYWSTRALVTGRKALPPDLMERHAAINDSVFHVLVGALRDSPVDLNLLARSMLERTPWHRAGLVLAGYAADRALRDDVLRLSSEGDATLGWTYPFALRRVGTAADASQLRSGLQSPDPSAAQGSLMAWLCLDVTSATPWVVQNFGSAIGLLGLTGDMHAVEVLLDSASAHAGRASFYLALGVLGDPRGVPYIVAGLANPTTAREAAAALHLISGEDFRDAHEEVRVAPDEELFSDELAQRQAGDATIGVVRTVTPALCGSAERWSQWIGAKGARLAAGQRYRLGRPLDRRVAVEALAQSWVPRKLRALLSAELAGVFGMDVAVDPDAPAALQAKQLNIAAALAMRTANSPPGAWGAQPMSRQ